MARMTLTLLGIMCLAITAYAETTPACQWYTSVCTAPPDVALTSSASDPRGQYAQKIAAQQHGCAARITASGLDTPEKKQSACEDKYFYCTYSTTGPTCLPTTSPNLYAALACTGSTIANFLTCIPKAQPDCTGTCSWVSASPAACLPKEVNDAAIQTSLKGLADVDDFADLYKTNASLWGNCTGSDILKLLPSACTVANLLTNADCSQKKHCLYTPGATAGVDNGTCVLQPVYGGLQWLASGANGTFGSTMTTIYGDCLAGTANSGACTTAATTAGPKTLTVTNLTAAGTFAEPTYVPTAPSSNSTDNSTNNGTNTAGSGDTTKKNAAGSVTVGGVQVFLGALVGAFMLVLSA